MIENNTIKKLVTGILRGRKNASFDRHIMHPEREWFLGMFIGGILFVVGIGWNVSTHLQFKNVSITSTSQVEETIIYRTGLVEEALANFAERKGKYEELKQGLLIRQVSVPVAIPIVTETEPISETEVPESSVEVGVTEVSPSAPVDPDAFMSPVE